MNKEEKIAVGVLGPQAYMEQAIDTLRETYEVHILNPQTWDHGEIQDYVQRCKDNNIQCVAGFAQKDAFHHVLVNEGLGNRVPSRLAFLYCMNKYLMRTLESKPFWFDYIDPEQESEDAIVAKIKEWPFMLKNTSLSLGRGIFKIRTAEELLATLRDYRTDTALQQQIAYQNEQITAGLAATELPEVAPPFVAEHLVDLNSLIEYCYEGYITADGEIVHYGLTEEVYFQNHQALGYLTPPMHLSAERAAVVEKWMDDYMGKMVELGYRNQFFNLEFWLTDADEIYLTEINPRAAHSFHYNYWYSFGCSLYRDNIELARHHPEGMGVTPWHKWRSGEDFKYTLIVLITSKTQDKVSNILDYDYVAYLEQEEKILIRHCRHRDDVLTAADMTAAGVMLLQLWVVGDSVQAVIGKEREIRRKLYRQVSEELVYPNYWDEEKWRD